MRISMSKEKLDYLKTTVDKEDDKPRPLGRGGGQKRSEISQFKVRTKEL